MTDHLIRLGVQYVRFVSRYTFLTKSDIEFELKKIYQLKVMDRISSRANITRCLNND